VSVWCQRPCGGITDPDDSQLWFDSLQAKARATNAAQAETTTHLDQLLPDMLNEAFGLSVIALPRLPINGM